MEELLPPAVIAIGASAVYAIAWDVSPATRARIDRAVYATWIVVGVWFVYLFVGRIQQPATWHPTLDELAKLGPIATAIAATVALIVGVGTVWQKKNADRRDQWWKRTEWALDWALGDGSDDESRSMAGWAAVEYQGRSKLAGDEEQAFLLACVQPIIDDYEDEYPEALADVNPGTGEPQDVVLVLADDTQQSDRTDADPGEEDENHDEG